ncbi:MAG: DUF998 domain-containing protein [Actinomycetota bacterium]|nr:DUF998 domain-containing protein [Actinomycetota bacterium]
MNAIAQSHSAPAALETTRLRGLAAMIAGPLFLVVVAVLTLVELDFMHGLGWGFTSDDRVPWPSGLVLGDYGAIQIANFALAGTLLAFFVQGFRRELPTTRVGRAAGLLVMVIAIGLVVAAFPTDSASAGSDSPNTWHGWLHLTGFVTIALSSLVAPIVTAIALRGNARWRGFPAFSVAVVVLEAVLFFPLDFLGDPAFVGYMAVLFAWFAALGARLPGGSGARGRAQ